MPQLAAPQCATRRNPSMHAQASHAHTLPLLPTDASRHPSIPAAAGLCCCLQGLQQQLQTLEKAQKDSNETKHQVGMRCRHLPHVVPAPAPAWCLVLAWLLVPAVLPCFLLLLSRAARCSRAQLPVRLHCPRCLPVLIFLPCLPGGRHAGVPPGQGQGG